MGHVANGECVFNTDRHHQTSILIASILSPFTIIDIIGIYDPKNYWLNVLNVDAL